MEKVAVYAKAGYIQEPGSGESVTRISLEYYVEEQTDGLVFYPVWNFQVSSLLGDGAFMFGKEMDDLFYIDAQTGMLVKSMA